MQPGPAKLLEDPTGGTNVVQLVLKMLHLSKMAWPQVQTQVASIIQELREKAPDGLKEKLVMPSEEEILAI